MNEVYQRMLPILQLAKCRRLKRKEIDKRLLAVENHEVYQRLKVFYEECPVEYWENLALLGDVSDLIILKRRKQALRNLWSACYGNANGNKKSNNTD